MFQNQRTRGEFVSTTGHKPNATARDDHDGSTCCCCDGRCPVLPSTLTYCYFRIFLLWIQSVDSGVPVAGVVYRPLSGKPTWAAGAKSEGYNDSNLSMASKGELDRAGLLTSNGSISPFIEELMKELDYPRTPSGGAGNTMLMLLEKKGKAYIQDRGVSRWDTAGAQAVIEVHGGVLCKLGPIINCQGKDESYTCLKSDTNLDFVAGEAHLSNYNAAAVGDMGDSKRMAVDESEVKPYANLCGLFAISAE